MSPKQKFNLVHTLLHSTPYEWYLSLRRRFLVKFRKKYVEQSIAKRKGYCQFPDCDCCYWANCKYCLGYKKGCAIRNNEPVLCKLYPIDSKDKIPRFPECTYYWDK